MTNPTPVAWMHELGDVKALDFILRPYGVQTPLFTAAQLNQARADALREAAAIFDQKHTQLKHCHNYHQCTARDLRAMAAEIEGEKK